MKTELFSVFLLALMAVFPATAAEQKESTYDRVARTKTIRCGYLPYEPYVIKDPNTGRLSGITVDYINAIGEKQGLKIDWAAEVNIDQTVPALDAGRIDAMCIPATPDYNWAKVVDFSTPLGALPYFVYVPFKSAITEVGLETATFAIVDGFALTDITKQAFPKAVYKSLTQTASTAEMYDQLRYGKVQAHVNEHISAMNYMRNNPGVIRRWSDRPVLVSRMFLLTPKSTPDMGAFMRQHFSADLPENLVLFRNLLAKYEVPEDAMVLGEQCKPAETEKGWTICAIDEARK